MLQRFFHHPLIRSSSIVFAGSFAANATNYLFNILMGRMLSVREYGEVAALVTLAMIVAVPAATLSTTMAKFTSEYDHAANHAATRALFRTLERGARGLGIVFFILFLALSGPIANFLQSSQKPIIIFALFLPISLAGAVTAGTLQGLKRFVTYATSGFIASVIKLIAAIAAVMLGWSVGGVIGAVVLGSLLGYLWNIRALTPFLKCKGTPADRQSLSAHHYPFLGFAFCTSFGLAALGNIDVVLAKHVLAPDTAGQYASLAILGRILTYGSLAVVSVALPLVAAQKNDPRAQFRTLWQSMGIVIASAVIILSAFILFPSFVIRIFFGAAYLPIAPLLGRFGVAMFFWSCAQVLIQFHIARHEWRGVVPLSVALLGLSAGILRFHASLAEITTVLITVNVILFCMLLGTVLVSRKKLFQVS